MMKIKYGIFTKKKKGIVEKSENSKRQLATVHNTSDTWRESAASSPAFDP